MRHVFFDKPLDTVATFWRVYRCDGIMLGFTSHNRDLAFGGIVHRAAPGMVPSSIRLTADLTPDSAEVEGALSHSTISERDLAAGIFDNAAIEIGAVDWSTREYQVLYSGQMGVIENDQRSFSAELRSAKRILEKDLVPRTSPTCRASFCGPGCNLSPLPYQTTQTVTAIDLDANRVAFDMIGTENFLDGQVRFLDGPQAGVPFGIVGVDPQGMSLDRQLSESLTLGTNAQLREGCDHTLGTCAARFGNALNFRGEPFLPGNDLLTRYGQSTG